MANWLLVQHHLWKSALSFYAISNSAPFKCNFATVRTSSTGSCLKESFTYFLRLTNHFTTRIHIYCEISIPSFWLFWCLFLFFLPLPQDGERKWLMIEYWIAGIVFLNLYFKSLDFLHRFIIWKICKIHRFRIWNIISFVMLISFDMYWNFVYHYKLILLCQLTRAK